jgi:hypothetical protein
MRTLTITFLLTFSICIFAQENAETTPAKKKNYGRIFGGLESNIQRYTELPETAPDRSKFRSNNFLLVNYQYDKFTAGVQVEAYESNALLNYYPGLKGTNFGTFFINYKSKKFDITLGYFYEQFGSGMILRAWEDRALGINSALRGAKIVYKPTDNIKLTALAGQQRSGFNVSAGRIFGFDSEFNMSDLFKFEESSLTIAGSYVGRYEKIDEAIIDPQFDPTTHAFSGRLNFSNQTFYANFEGNYKSKDAVLSGITADALMPEIVKDGHAFLFNFGYANKGLGIDATLRRSENMLFLSERKLEALDAFTGNPGDTNFNFFNKIISFGPSLTKQHHSNLANIYVYQANVGVNFQDESKMTSGETGGQIDIFYDFAKNTTIGGKYGTKIALNFASWYTIPGSYRNTPLDYKTKFFGIGENLYRDLNIEVKKRFTKDFRASILFVNQYVNALWLGLGNKPFYTNIYATELIYSFNSKKSLKLDVEYMQADSNTKNWFSAAVEYNLNEKLSFFAMDMINNGNATNVGEPGKHYFTVGSAYRKGSTRVALSYGRQRAGLVCIGGVCRFVPESTGVSLSLNRAF